MLIVKILIIWFVLTIVRNAYLMTLPKLDFQKKDYPEKYHIKTANRIDIQQNYECAAFSTAYILRHFGIGSHGLELYTNFPSKMKSGCVYPKGIQKYFKKIGFKTNYFKGNISSLKKQISRGTPVIVFIKVHTNGGELHYVPVIGYDKDYFYLAESLEHLINCRDSSDNYNRKVSIEEFEKLWDIKNFNMPLYSNTYITVEKIQKA